MNCPVCGNGPEWHVWLHRVRRCPCGLWGTYGHALAYWEYTRVGHVDGDPIRPVLDEAKRMLADDERRAVCPETDDDHTHWMIYADWLDEHDYPLNAAAVRARHSYGKGSL